jgi:hypothetical protein
MKFIKRWIGVGILILFTVVLFSKGLNLWFLGTNVDGDGVGINFLVFEINDSVSADSLPTYTFGFFVLSLIFLIISIMVIRTKLKTQTQR